MAWLLQYLVDGKPPGAWSWVVDDHAPAPGEVLTSIDPEGRVWDDASKALRDRTPLERTARDAEMLAIARSKKIAELLAAADAAYDRDIPSFAGVVIAAKFVPPNNTQYLNARELAVFNQISAGYAKLNALLDQVNAATTIVEINAVRW